MWLLQGAREEEQEEANEGQMLPRILLPLPDLGRELATEEKEMTLWQKAVHQLYDFSRLIGLRDRLRCPDCKAVGTFKPHGGWLDFEDKRKERRWMCKWCGGYSGPEPGLLRVLPNLLEGCWTNPSQVGTVATPQTAHNSHFWKETRPCWTPWPWAG